MLEKAGAWGRYHVECRGPDGALKWQDVIENVVTTVGKNLALDTYLSGAAYTVTGPYLGLISSSGYTGVAAADTMSSHAGWAEAGAATVPTYTAPRQSVGFASASGGSKVSNVPISFSITGGGTLKGAFLVYGPGAVATIDNTSGVLYSAGLFVEGDKVVANGDIVNVTYTAGL